MSHTRISYGPLPLRLMLAAGFILHGLPKLTQAGHQLFVTSLQSMHVPLPSAMAWIVAVLEVAGGLLLLLGYRVRVAVLPLIADMLVAMFLVHWPYGFNAVNMTIGPNGPRFGMPGIELNLLYLAMLVSLWLTGAGRLSLDERRDEPRLVPIEPPLGAMARRERELLRPVT